MTDSWVINGTTLGNVASRIEVAQDLQTTPERVDDTLPIPGTHGVLDLGLLRYGPGTITFRMWVKGVNPTTGLFVGTGEAEYFARVDELVNLFSARTLLVDHVRSDGTRRATARLSGELKFDRERSVPLFGRFTATLLIPGAFWVGTADVTASGTVATGATISLAAFAPSNAPISDGTVTFGPCSNPTLYTSGGATFVAYDGIITAGRQLTINSADWSLGAGSGTAWTPSMSVLRYGPGPTWFEVDPTGALTVTFAHTGGGTAFASFTGRQKWLTA